jgi:hypothetical protein
MHTNNYESKNLLCASLCLDGSNQPIWIIVVWVGIWIIWINSCGGGKRGGGERMKAR